MNEMSVFAPLSPVSYLWIGESGNKSRLSETDELGLGVVSGRQPFRMISTFFLTRPRLFSNLLVSIEAARRLTDLPGFASGFIIHHDDFPVPSFCTRMKRLCNDRLCRIEFCNTENRYNYFFVIIIIDITDVERKNTQFAYNQKIYLLFFSSPSSLFIYYQVHCTFGWRTCIKIV